MTKYCFKVYWLSCWLGWSMGFKLSAQHITTPNSSVVRNTLCIQRIATQLSVKNAQTDDLNKVASKDQSDLSAPLRRSDQDRKPVLDEYDVIKDLYAYDPVVQKWVKIKDFQVVKAVSQKQITDIDWTMYTQFWAYNHQNEWVRVSLTKFLQKNFYDRSRSIPYKKGNISGTTSSSQEYSRQDFLEELLKKESKPLRNSVQHQQWTKFSWYFSVGVGGLFIENKLGNMGVVCKGNQSFLKLPNNVVYKPNWFAKTLYKVNDFTLSGMECMCLGGMDSFKGYGMALPFTFGLVYHFKKPFVIGLGKEIVINRIGPLHYYHMLNHEFDFRVYNPWFMQSRAFMQGGWYLFQYAKHKIMTDIRLLLIHHVGDKWHQVILPFVYLYQTIAYNFGLTYEHSLSDHLALTTRWALEYQRFKEFGNHSSFNVYYTQPAMYIQCGLAMKI